MLSRPKAVLRQRPNEALKPTALAGEAAGSLRSPAALLVERRGLTLALDGSSRAL